MTFRHSFDFDPAYGYALEQLLEVRSPEPPDDFESFWRGRYERALQLKPHMQLRELEQSAGRRVFELSFPSTDGVTIKGWLTLPALGPVERAIRRRAWLWRAHRAG